MLRRETPPPDPPDDETLAQRIVDRLEKPMAALGFLWFGLLILESG